MDRDVVVEVATKMIPELQLLFVFGSQADGTAHSDSDLDLAFKSADKLSSLERYDIAQDIAASLNIDVDLVDLDNCGAVLANEVAMKGQLLKGDDAAADYFFVQAMREYQDHKARVRSIEDDLLMSLRGKS